MQPSAAQLLHGNGEKQSPGRESRTGSADALGIAPNRARRLRRVLAPGAASAVPADDLPEVDGARKCMQFDDLTRRLGSCIY
jgi:hypothetical protein